MSFDHATATTPILPRQGSASSPQDLPPHSANSDLLEPFDAFTFVESDLRARERQFLLSCERGDIGSVRKLLQADTMSQLINCIDPLGRNALLIAIENENIEMMEVLLDHNISTGDAILYAIGEENIEACEILVAHLEKIDKFNQETQGVEINEHSAFTPDITPLILAAHKDNYECVKLFLDKKGTVPHPHDVRCSCNDCHTARHDDSLRLSRSRINAYRALASPSMMCLSAKDPILYAFELSWELRRLSYIENEFRTEYQELSQKCQKFSVNMLDQVRGSKELDIVLNHTTNAWESVSTKVAKSTEQLARLKLAIKLGQKNFVAHPHCQQLLSAIWYDGIPGFRNRNVFFKVLLIILMGMSFPFFSIVYLFAPSSSCARFIKKPFVKFVAHSGSYISFLLLIIMASQRIESWDNVFADDASNRKERRGPSPTPIELMIVLYVAGLIWVEIKQLWDSGLHDYCHNLWNILDFITNSLYLSTCALRTVAYVQVEKEMRDPLMRHIGSRLQRKDWDAWDPTLVSECLFATANIFSSLKLVHLFTVNPHLGPLKISLGRMVIDIVKFFLVYTLVLFAFACGLNQLMWYYASIREQECSQLKLHLANPDVYPLNEAQAESYRESCDPKHKSCASIYHTAETLFWAMFGIIDLSHFQLKEGHWLTEWTGKTIFGSYSCVSCVVLLNTLIAMMSNSYQAISDQADVEWKFARTRLFMDYFDDSGTLPPPFNIIPSPKSFFYGIKWFCDRYCDCSKIIHTGKQKSIRNQKILRVVNDRENNYRFVTRNLVKRYIAQTQRNKQKSEGVCEDDVNEIKQDISAFRYELLGILRDAGFNTGHADMNQKAYSRNKKRSAMYERRLTKGLPELDMPVPESFNRRSSATSPPSDKTSPRRLSNINWKKIKKRVSFRTGGGGGARNNPSMRSAMSTSIDSPPETLISNGSTASSIITRSFKPKLNSLRKKSYDTVLQLDSDDLL